jgi:hypothetical protein
MNHDIHSAIIERQTELNELADKYDAAGATLRQVARLELELKMPDAVVINRAEKEQRLKDLKQSFNALQIIHLFSNHL